MTRIFRRARLAPRGEDGFALLAVLWVLVGVSALALAARLAARESVLAATNRADLAVAAWRAEECVERVRAMVSRELKAGANAGPADDPWGDLDRRLAADPRAAALPCRVSVRAAGTGMDVNAADEETLRRLFAALGAGAAGADSLADALADWRDADDEPRPGGAEAGWYAAAGRPAPRNAPLADAREVRRVRGFERIAGLDTLLTVEAGRIPLNQAPLAVLAALPGMTPEAAARIAELRLRGVRMGGLIELEAGLSPASRAALLRGYAELTALTTDRPDAWVVTARADEGTPGVTSVLEVRLARAGTRAAVVRRRTWIE